MLFRHPEPRPGPPRAKKNFLATEKFILLHFAAWRPRRVRKIIFRPRFFLGAQGLRKLKTCFSASGGSGGMREAPKGSGGAQNQFSSCFCGVQGLQRRPGRSKRPRRAQKQFVELRKMLFWCPESRSGAPRAKKKFGDGKVYFGVFRSLEAPAGAKNKFKAAKN